MLVKLNEREYREYPEFCDERKAEVRMLEDGQEVVEGYATTWDEYLRWDDG